tara:strand:+ start:1398 stop:1775 length:378 start_codon:yes stop_codon:yes gene_type:complete
MNLKDRIKQKLYKQAFDIPEAYNDFSPSELFGTGSMEGVATGMPMGLGMGIGGMGGAYAGGRLGGYAAGKVLPPWARGLGIVPGALAGGLMGGATGGGQGLMVGAQGVVGARDAIAEAIRNQRSF